MSVFQVKIDQGIESQDQVAHYRLILPEEKDMLFFCKLRQRNAEQFVTNTGVKPCYILNFENDCYLTVRSISYVRL